MKPINGYSKRNQNDYEKNLIKSLDLDFLQYLIQLDACRNQINSDLEKKLVQAWCDKLLGEKRLSVAQKRRRNIFISQLILTIQSNQISSSPIFSKPPTALSSYPASVFNFTPPLPESTNIIGQLDKDYNKCDLSNYASLSDNKRTLIATRKLPNGRGFMAYVGIATGSEPIWTDSQGKTLENLNINGDSANKFNHKNVKCGGEDRHCKIQGVTRSQSIQNKGLVEWNEEQINFHDNLYKRICNSMKYIETMNRLPDYEDPYLNRIVENMQRKFMTKTHKLNGMSKVHRYYEMLKLIRNCIENKARVMMNQMC